MPEWDQWATGEPAAATLEKAAVVAVVWPVVSVASAIPTLRRTALAMTVGAARGLSPQTAVQPMRLRSGA